MDILINEKYIKYKKLESALVLELHSIINCLNSQTTEHDNLYIIALKYIGKKLRELREHINY